MSSRDKRRGLARGLDDLLGNLADPRSAAVNTDEAAPVEVELERLLPNPFQPRKSFPAEALQELADSIRVQGLLAPLLVRPKAGDEGRYEVIAGERRLRAAKLAGLERVPVVVRRVDDRTGLVLGLMENLQREDLRPIELAEGLQQLVERFGLTQAELARGLGVSREQVSNTLRLLKLPERVRELVDEGRLTPGHGRLLASLRDPGTAQALGELAVEKDLTVRELEMLISSQPDDGTPPGVERPSSARREPERDPDLALFEEELQRRIGTQVRIRHQKTGRGRIIILYYSSDELAGIIEKLTGRQDGAGR